MTKPAPVDLTRRPGDGASPGAFWFHYANTSSTATKGTIRIGRSGEVVFHEEQPAYRMDWSRTYVPILGLLGMANALTPPAGMVTYVGASAGSGAVPILAVASASLTESLGPTIRTITEMMSRLAQERSISASRVRVSTFIDPEAGGEEEVVLTQAVNLPADRALAYWDDVSDAIERWAKTLEPNEAEQVNRYIAVRVQWTGG